MTLSYKKYTLQFQFKSLQAIERYNRMRALCKKMIYHHVGRKHIEKIVYTPQSCRDFNLLLQSQTSQQNKRKISSKAVNRLFVSCLFSRIIGNNFPLSIYLSQTINIKRDIQFNEEVLGEIQVKKDLGKKKYEITTLCKSPQGETLVQGIAIILQE